MASIELTARAKIQPEGGGKAGWRRPAHLGGHLAHAGAVRDYSYSYTLDDEVLTGPAWLEYERRARRASWWDVWFDVLTLVAVIALLGYGLMDPEGFLRSGSNPKHTYRV